MKPEDIAKLKELTIQDLHNKLTSINSKIYKLGLERQQVLTLIKSMKKKL
jgi:hypothetical protein